MAIKDRLYDVPVVGTALRLQDRYEDDAADQFAASIGFFSFLSLFPLLLIAVAVAGFVVQGDADAQRRLVQTALDVIPGISAALSGGGGDQTTQVAAAIDAIIENAGTIGLVGAVTLLLSGLRVVNAAMIATQTVFHVEVDIAGWKMKLRQVGALVLLGLLALLGVAATAALGVAVNVDVSSVTAVLTSIGSVLVSVLLDFALFSVAYRVLAVGEGPGFRRLWPGALLSAVAWTALKAFGATYVSGQVAKANDLYGTLGGVIALLLLFYLAGRIYLYGAELSGVLYEPGLDLARRDEDVAFEGDVGPSEAVDPADPAAIEEDATYATALDGPATDGEGTATVDDGPRSAPRLTPEESSPTVGASTRSRMAAADRAREGRPTPVRPAIAFAIAIGAVGALAGILKPWQHDD